MKKKWLAFLLCVCMVLSLLPATALAADNGRTVIGSGACGMVPFGHVTWMLYSDGELSISGSGPMANYGFDSSIHYASPPWDDHRDTITSLTVDSGVEEIGRYAFEDCTNLTSVIISEGVFSIGALAFKDCTNLTNVTLPRSLTSLGDVFPRTSNLKTAGPVGGNYNIQFAWQTAIPKNAFSDCESLTSVTLPEGVAKIGEYAFSGCAGLTSVTIPAGVSSIETGTFYDCTGLTNVVIPENVTSIGSIAFADCDNLTSVTIPASVTDIGLNAFWHNYRMTAYVPAGSVAEAYCKENDIPTDRIENAPTASAPVAPAQPAEPVQPVVPTQTAYPSAQSVDVDGRAVEFQCYALKDASGNDTNYIRLRDLAAVLNGTMAQFNVGFYSGSVHIITGWPYIPDGTEQFTPFSGQRACRNVTGATDINGVPAALDAIILTDDAGGGYTYYKLRDLGNAIGFTVDWSADSGILIKTN